MSIFEEIKLRVNILDVAERYTRVKKLGRYWRGRCPLHDDRLPSFAVWPEKGRWWCFACNTGGSVIDLVAQVEGVSPQEAARRLAEELGLPWGRSLRPEKWQPLTDLERRRRDRLWDRIEADWRDLYWWAAGDQLASRWCQIRDELLRDPFCDEAAKKWQELTIIDLKLDILNIWKWKWKWKWKGEVKKWKE